MAKKISDFTESELFIYNMGLAAEKVDKRLVDPEVEIGRREGFGIGGRILQQMFSGNNSIGGLIDFPKFKEIYQRLKKSLQ